MLTKQDVDRMLELFGPNGERWFTTTGERTCGYCVATALRAICDEFNVFMEKLPGLKLGDTPSDVFDWNDAPGRTFAEVKAALLAAVEGQE